MKKLTIERVLELGFAEIPGEAIESYAKGNCVLYHWDNQINYKDAVISLQTENDLGRLYYSLNREILGDYKPWDELMEQVKEMAFLPVNDRVAPLYKKLEDALLKVDFDAISAAVKSINTYNDN